MFHSVTQGGETKSVSKPPSEAVLVEEKSSLEVLEGLMLQIEQIKKELRSSLQSKDRVELETALQRLRQEFEDLLAGKESVAIFQNNPSPKSLQEDLLEIFDPLIGEIKNATADSREKEELRNKIELLQQRRDTVEAALERISRHKAEEGEISHGLASVIKRKEKFWLSRKKQNALELESAKLQLEDKQIGSKNAVESASKVIAKFFKTRGLHLLLSFFIALVTYALIVFGYKGVTRFSPLHRKERFAQQRKTIDGAVHLGSFLASIIGFILTLFLCDDWVLLTAFLLLIVGVVWTVKDKFMDITEEIRLILNVGAVREGERIMFEGLPWRIEKIRVYSQLFNPELEGGKMRIPVNHLVGLHSRSGCSSERFFPTSKNDWVLLSDETFGKILHQNPNYVELVQLGGAHKTYRTQSFLDLTPQNLSGHSFRITSTIGVGYQYQSEVTDKIAAQFQESIKAGLLERLESSSQLKRVKVEFANAGASSLDLEILADFDSMVAPRYSELKRLIQRLAVEACSENEWEIPFAQLTLHQAS